PLSLPSFPTRRSSDLFVTRDLGFAANLRLSAVEKRDVKTCSTGINRDQTGDVQRLGQISCSLHASGRTREDGMDRHLLGLAVAQDRKSTRLNSSHQII